MDAEENDAEQTCQTVRRKNKGKRQKDRKEDCERRQDRDEHDKLVAIDLGDAAESNGQGESESQLLVREQFVEQSVDQLVQYKIDEQEQDERDQEHDGTEALLFDRFSDDVDKTDLSHE